MKRTLSVLLLFGMLCALSTNTFAANDEAPTTTFISVFLPYIYQDTCRASSAAKPHAPTLPFRMSQAEHKSSGRQAVLTYYQPFCPIP